MIFNGYQRVFSDFNCNFDIKRSNVIPCTLNTYLFNSQPCESMFQQARALSETIFLMTIYSVCAVYELNYS